MEKQRPQIFYQVYSSALGRWAIAWQGTETVSIRRVFLPQATDSLMEEVHRWFPAAVISDSPAVRTLSRHLTRILDGYSAKPPTALLAWGTCSDFQRRVLLTEVLVPRGRVTTYGTLARAIGREGAARAVGRALATNPFPLCIPCHRTVRSDGALGGFRGGLPMKRRLLQMEGVEVDDHGCVDLRNCLYTPRAVGS